MCTAISYNSTHHYFGRTLDIEHLYGESVTVIPRSFKIKYRYAGEDKRHYAIIGMATVVDNFPLLYDGTNECGLSIAGLNFSGNARFCAPCEGKSNIAGFELPLLILARCKSTDEAVALLNNAVITDDAFNEKLKSAKLHWMISDRCRTVTLEVTECGMRIFENEVGVMTNDPPFDFHMTNLRRYVNLTADEVMNTFSDSISLTPNSRGAGAIGLPGDYSSASRFVRAAFVKTNSKKHNNECEDVEQFFRILDSVSVPDGCVRLGEAVERTEYTSCCDTDNGIYYYKTYENSRIRAVKMKNENLDADTLFCYSIKEAASFDCKN